MRYECPECGESARRFYNAGIAFVDRVPMEALNDPEEIRGIVKRFLRRLGEAR